MLHSVKTAQRQTSHPMETQITQKSEREPFDVDVGFYDGRVTLADGTRVHYMRVGDYIGTVRSNPPLIQHPPETRFVGGQKPSFAIDTSLEKEIYQPVVARDQPDMTTTQIINLTQLTLRIKSSHEPDAPIAVYQPSQNPATIAVTSVDAGDIDGVCVVRNVFGIVKNLPEPQENTYYVVSLPVGERYGSTSQHARSDRIGPNTNDAVYVTNEKGARVLDYCHGWVRY